MAALLSAFPSRLFQDGGVEAAQTKKMTRANRPGGQSGLNPWPAPSCSTMPPSAMYYLLAGMKTAEAKPSRA
jgi:hypothetical protein